jgi:hypothetical protein
MAKLTRTNSKAALVEGKLTFSAGHDRLPIGLTSDETASTSPAHDRSRSSSLRGFRR